MLFVALLKVKAGSTAQERIGRRAQWQYPDGVKSIAEYWLENSETGVVAIFEADSNASIMAITSAWNDLFDITVVPAVTAEDGLQLAQQLMP